MKYIKIFPFMTQTLGLKGVDLMVFAYINTYCFLNQKAWEENYVELAEYTGISVGAVNRSVNKLVKQGMMNETYERDGKVKRYARTVHCDEVIRNAN